MFCPSARARAPRTPFGRARPAARAGAQSCGRPSRRARGTKASRWSASSSSRRGRSAPSSSATATAAPPKVLCCPAPAHSPGGRPSALTRRRASAPRSQLPGGLQRRREGVRQPALGRAHQQHRGPSAPCCSLLLPSSSSSCTLRFSCSCCPPPASPAPALCSSGPSPCRPPSPASADRPNENCTGLAQIARLGPTL